MVRYDEFEPMETKTFTKDKIEPQQIQPVKNKKVQAISVLQKAHEPDLTGSH